LQTPTRTDANILSVLIKLVGNIPYFLASANQPLCLPSRAAGVDSILECVLGLGVDFPVQNLLPDTAARQTNY